MTRTSQPLSALLLFTVITLLFSCEVEDPGPLQEVSEHYSLVDFDRLEIGSAFHIEVEQAGTFSIRAKGDRRNINDLDVYKKGNTLIIEYDESADRRHDTYITITMPVLKSVNFSGSSVSVVKGFESDDKLDYFLSGSSASQLDAGYREVNLVLSGASTLVMRGLGDEITAGISGASELSALDFPLREATINVSGSSSARVTVSDELHVIAAGSSAVLYQGNPTLETNASGSSRVERY
jgi:hypothetical protein